MSTGCPRLRWTAPRAALGRLSAVQPIAVLFLFSIVSSEYASQFRVGLTLVSTPCFFLFYKTLWFRVNNNKHSRKDGSQGIASALVLYVQQLALKP